MPASLDVLKNDTVTRMFVDTADQNYVIARWAFHRGLYLDFFWNSVHALEKYLKASLLLNGRSAIRNAEGRSFGHNLNLLIDEVATYADDYLPQRLTQPEQMKQLRWREETPVEFLSRFYDLGEANNRYNLFGYVQRWEDLHHLDLLVFALRRIAFDLTAHPFLGNYPLEESDPKSLGELLVKFPDHSPRSNNSRLFKMLNTKGPDELRDAGLHLNFVFAPSDYDHSRFPVQIGTSGSNSALYSHIMQQLENSPSKEMDQEAADLANWVIDNIQLPRPLREELRSHAVTLATR